MNSEAKNVPAPSVSWRVTGQQQTVETGTGNQPVRGYRIMFATGTGASGSVFVPQSAYNRQNVAAVVGTAAAEVAAVQNLTG